MGKYTGMLLGGLAGMMSEVGKGMADIGVAEAKSKTEMTLMEARAKLERDRDLSLAEIAKGRDATQQGYAIERQRDDQLFRGVESEEQRGLTREENAANRTQQEKLAAMREAGDDRRSGASIAAADKRDSNRMKSEELRDTFTDKDGFLRRKASGAVVTDPETGQPIKGTRTFANGEERDASKARIDAAKDDVKTLEGRIKNAYGAEKKALEVKLADAKRRRNELVGLDEPNSTSSNMAPRPVGGQMLTPDANGRFNFSR